MPKHQKKLVLGTFCAAILAVLFWQNPGTAVIGIPVASAQVLTGGISDNVFWLFGFLIGLLQFVSFVAFALLNYLLDPKFIFDLGGGNDFLNVLQSIWQLSRDIMNVLFAVMLVFAAIYVIVMNKKDFIQEHVAKFLIAVVFVNFSWFFPRVILDVSAVLTSTVYGIPSLIDNPCLTQDNEECVAVTGVIFLPDQDQVNALDGRSGWDCRSANYICVQIQPLNGSTVSQSSTVLNGLIINHARLIKMGQVPPPDLSDDSPFDRKAQFAMRQAVILLILIATVFPLIAMCIAFLLRIPMLWLTVAFMPFYFLDLVGGEKISQGYGQKIFDNFLKAAFLPALVAIPLSVGYILLNAGSQVAFDALNGIPFRLLDNVSTLHELLWLFLALGVIWTGVFGVLKQQEILGKGAEKIEGFGKAVGKLAVSVPLATPLIPGPGGGPTISGLLKAPGTFQSLLSQGFTSKQAASQTIERVRNPGGGSSGEAEVAKAVTTIQSNPTFRNTFNQRIQAIERAGTAAEVKTNAEQLARELNQRGITTANSTNLRQVLEDINHNAANRGANKLIISDTALDKLRNPPAAAPTPAPTPTPAPPAATPPAAPAA